MKTAEEILKDTIKERGLSILHQGKNFKAAYIAAMEAYHAAQLSAGIKAKALRKKGTDKWYYFYPHDASFRESSYPDLFSDVDMTVERIPKDAELVNIIILGGKP